MCGAIGMVTDSSDVRELCELLGIRLGSSDYDIRPTASISIAIDEAGSSTGVEATWWLDQQRTLFGYDYDKRWRSFNTRAEKLFTTRRREFSESRCILPASFFCEWKSERYKIEPVDGAIAFGGIYKRWPLSSGETHYSCSLITLPPHPRFSHIHSKSFPLMLLPNEREQWLSSSFDNPSFWRPRLESKIRFDLRVTPVDRQDPSVEIGDSVVIEAD